MKKIILIGLCIIALVLTTGAGYRFYLSKYEEVCTKYQMNVTAYCKHYIAKISGKDMGCIYRHNYIQTDKCIEYQLIRKTDIEPFVYLFDWCEVYPNSVTQDC